MTEQLFIGIDVGTYETKGVLVDAHGIVLARARRRHEVSTPAPGHVEHDADAVWWADVTAVARELTATEAARSGTIAAVGCSAIGPCVLPVDANLRPLRPAILYGVDTRATAEIELLRERLGDEEILRRSGNELTSQSSGPKIAWVARNEPEVAAQTRWYLTSQSYLVARLTGEVTIDHGTAGYYHPLYDFRKQDWDVSGCEDFVRLEQLPRLAWATEIAGTVTDAASAATGIPVGVPVIVGPTDAPAEAVGSGVVEAGDLMLMYGSSTFMIEVLDYAHVDPTLWSAPFVFPGSYVLAAGTSTAGTVTRWLADMLGIDGGRGDAAMFSELLELAQRAPVGSDGLLMLPHLSGERTPVHDPYSRGSIMGLSMRHGREHLARAAMEAVGHSVAHALSAYTAADAEPSRVVAVGGGTRNPIFTQTVTDITGLTQHVADSDGASLGDAALAAYAVGLLKSRRDIAEWVAIAGRVTADSPDRSARLRADHDDYRAFYDSIAPLNHRRSS